MIKDCGGLQVFVTEDKQALFDLVVQKLAEQGEPAVEPGTPGTCSYENDDGARCAAGHTFTPEFRAIAREPASRHSALSTLLKRRGIRLPDELKGLVSELQAAHDTSHTRRALRIKLCAVAVDCRLDASSLERWMPDSWTGDAVWREQSR